MVFNDVTYRDEQNICHQWRLYFENLYSPSNNISYDDNWKNEVTHTLNNAIQSKSLNRIVHVTENEIKCAIQSCKRGKASGIDKLFYEHFILGGAVVIHALSILFTLMLRESHIPLGMKKGIIVTIHKGNNKRKDDPNNFRAITLMPTVLKLYESVLLGRSSKTILQNINSQQGSLRWIRLYDDIFSTQRNFTVL
jgi:hypothetical protein